MELTKSKGRQGALDYCETLSEELQMNGFNTKVEEEGFEIVLCMDTMAGKLTYRSAYKNIMQDYYRFIRIYGNKLAGWALKQQKQLKEHSKINLKS